MYRILIFIISLFMANQIFAQRIELPTQLHYYQPASSVFGAEAVWTNPAGLSVYRASDAQVFADFYKGKFAKNWGTVLTQDGFGLSYKKVDVNDGTDFNEYIFAGGLSLENNLHAGISYQYYKNAPSFYHKKHFWNIGLIGKFNPKYKWGVVLSNLNRSTINSEKTETEMRYSIAYRPSGNKFTFAVDAFLSTKTKIRNADFIYHIDARPIPGVMVNAYIDRHKNFEIGFRVNFFQSFIGARRSSNKNGHHRGTTIFYGSTSERQEAIVHEPKRRLLTNLDGPLPENPPQPTIGHKQISYLHLLQDIYRAADDNSIDEMVVSLKKPLIGFAQAEELADALKYFKSKKKRIICHLTHPSNLTYYIASFCDNIYLAPVSQLKLVGLKAEITFYAGTLDKIGVKAEILKIGDYKTAAETFTQEASSEENKEQINRLLDNLYDLFLSNLAKNRSFRIEKMKSLIDQGPFTSEEALEYGLVDGLGYLDELKELYPEMVYKHKSEITLNSYHADTILYDRWEDIPEIAVIVAEGEVQPDKNNTMFDGNSDVRPGIMKRAIKQAFGNRQSQAILLRVNSPGGLALAGEEIYHVFNKYKYYKPMTISMGNIAASGGYYFSMAGDRLFANNSTITGSIGIFGGKVDLSELHKKISLNKELYTRGKFAGMLSQVRPFTTEERDKYFSHLKSMYDHFVQLVADNRSLPIDSVDNISQGKVWTGNEAIKIGLIDEIGGFNDALHFIAHEQNLSDYRIEIYPKKTPFIIFPGNSIFSKFTNLIKSNSIHEAASEYLPILSPEDFYTRMPFDISIE